MLDAYVPPKCRQLMIALQKGIGRTFHGESFFNLSPILPVLDVGSLYTAKVSSANDQIAEEDWKDFP